MTRKIISSLCTLAGLASALLSAPAGLVRCAAQGAVFSAPSNGSLADKVGIDQKLNAQIPLDTDFKDETGAAVKLGDYFKQRPVILVMPFYRCAGTCLLEMDGLMRAGNALDYNLGKEYEIIVVSLDPRETPELAAAKKRDYLLSYGRPNGAAGLHCLTGTKENIAKLADAIGFRFYYDPRSGAPVHSAGLMVATPHGLMSRYLLGVDFAPRNLKLALVEASENRIGGLSEKITLLCSQYDPRSGKYTVAIVRLLQITGCGTVLILATFIGSMVYLERSRKIQLVDAVPTEKNHAS